MSPTYCSIITYNLLQVAALTPLALLLAAIGRSDNIGVELTLSDVKTKMEVDILL